MQEADHFVAGKVFPSVPVSKQSDLYFQYAQEDFFRDEVQYRADGTESAGSGYGLSTASYSANVWALHKDIGDQTRANADAPLNMDQDATRYLAQQMLIRQERDWATNYFGTGIWDTDTTPATLWSAANSDPIGDVQAGINSMLSSTGYRPNVGVCSYAVFSILKNHSEIVERYKYTTSESMTTDLIARVLGLDELYVMGSIVNSADEGATASYAQIGDKDMLLAYVPASAGLMQPSAGYNFSWTGLANSGGIGTSTSVSRFRMDHLRADRLEIQSAWDFKVVSSALGYFFSNCVA
ncbi:MAG: major capsid protein, partial [Ilumatobacteraceae bacterium]